MRTRIASIAVARPLSCDRDALKQKLADLWAHSTSAANFAMAELVKSDIVRTPATTKEDFSAAMKSLAYVYGRWQNDVERGQAIREFGLRTDCFPAVASENKKLLRRAFASENRKLLRRASGLRPAVSTGSSCEM